MALPKALKEILDNQKRIMAALGIDPEAERPEDETPALDPDATAARLDYDSYSAKEIEERVDSLSEAERKALATYEAANKNRKTVLEALRSPSAFS